MEDELASALELQRAQLDAIASMLIALTVTVCRANPRAFSQIEAMSQHHNDFHARRVQAEGLSSLAAHMPMQLEVLLATVRMTLANDGRKR